jgi:hypothetical protein
VAVVVVVVVMAVVPSSFEGAAAKKEAACAGGGGPAEAALCRHPPKPHPLQNSSPLPLIHVHIYTCVMSPPLGAVNAIVSHPQLRPFPFPTPPARETGQRERIAGLLAVTPRSSARSWSPCLTPIQPISAPLIAISYRPDCGSF